MTDWRIPNPVRDILNELRWHPDRDPAKARIFYVNRSSPKGFVEVRGDEIAGVDASNFHVETSTIPLYKVFRITYGDEVLLERPRP